MPVFDKGVLISCNHNQLETRLGSIGGTGINICGNGFHKDTRGECKPVYKFRNPLDSADVQPREIGDLRKYLQSKNRFN